MRAETVKFILQLFAFGFIGFLAFVFIIDWWKGPNKEGNDEH